MNNLTSYKSNYAVYPGEYIPLPKVRARLKELQLSKNDLPLHLPVNIDEFEDCYKIIAVIPGVSRENIFINVKNDLLSITVLHGDMEERSEKFKIHEFEGKYSERQIFLPYDADPAFVSSEYQAGILHICIPKSESPVNAFSSRIVTY
ncbi:MAG: Hsp20/alpha crystallin family protein [Ginsengibacter sp.]